MNRLRLGYLSHLLCLGLSICFSSSLKALEPPTPEQIRQYKADGTWAQRVADAQKLGNHLVPSQLAARTRARIHREAAKAAGLPVNGPEFAPPPGWAGGLPSKGTVNVVVLLVEFPDANRFSLTQTVSDASSKFFGDGDSGEYPYDSLRNFYQRSSYSQLTIQGNVLGWYMAAHDRSYYLNLSNPSGGGGTGTGAGQEALMMEALNYYDSSHDFAQYDNDNNGTIDALFLKWTGSDNGWPNFWWAYQWNWHANPDYRVDGKAIGRYVWSWYARNPSWWYYYPHTDIHETGHLLGLPDLYDYDDTVGPRGGVGDLDMMDANWGDHNCFSKFMLEWLTPTFVTSGSQTRALNPSGSSQDCVLIMPAYQYTSGNLFDEFFMAQYRKRSTGNDPSDYPTDGLVVWHIDSTLTPDNWDFLYNNSYTTRKMVRLMEADGLEQIETGGSANGGDFYTSPKTFDDATTPSSKDYTGGYTGVQINGLGAAGSTMNATFAVTNICQMQAAGWNITYETCTPSNGAVDPDETVTINFSLVNTGTAPTTNLVGTLQPTGGVTSPGSPGTFGASTPGGPAVSRPFTFTATGACGSTITATLTLQDGTTTFPPVTFDIPLGVSNGSGGYTCCYIPDGFGDFDGDGDVDQEDFGRFQACLATSGVVATEACQLGRLDLDQDVDQADLAIFQRCHTRPGAAPNPSCRNQ